MALKVLKIGEVFHVDGRDGQSFLPRVIAIFIETRGVAFMGQDGNDRWLKKTNHIRKD